MPPKNLSKSTSYNPLIKKKSKSDNDSASISGSETDTELEQSNFMSFETHNQSVIDISEYIEKQKQDLDRLYGDKIIELCKNNPSTKIYESVDNIYQDVYGNIKLQSLPRPLYWYDMNKKNGFIDSIHGYQGKIFKTYNFELYNSEYVFHDESIYNKIHYKPISFNMRFQPRSHTVQPLSNREDINVLIRDCSLKKPSKLPNIDGNNLEFHCGNTGPNQVLKVIIDDHLNIYLPEYNLIIIKNYKPFSFGSINDIFDMENILVYNSKNEEDKQKFTNISSFIGTITGINSQDNRNKMEKTLFDKLFDFLDYDNRINKIKKNIKYIEILMQQGNSKPVIDELNITKDKLKKTENELVNITSKFQNYEKETVEQIKNLTLKYNDIKSELDKYTNIIIPDMTPEQMKCKICNLENIIIVLENDLSTYKGEISVYKEYYDNRQKEILTLQQNNIQLTEIIAKNQIEIQKLTNDTINIKVLKSKIQTLENQLKNIDSIRDEENITFQNKITDLNAMITKLELENMNNQKKLNIFKEVEMEIEKLKSIKLLCDDKNHKLNEVILKMQSEKQSIISKCVILNDRIIELEEQNKKQLKSESQLKSTQDELNRKLLVLENIIREKEIEINIIKENKISSLENIGKKGDYEGILYSQIKDLENDNNKLKNIILQKEDQIKLEKSKYINIKEKIKELFQHKKGPKKKPNNLSESSDDEFY